VPVDQVAHEPEGFAVRGRVDGHGAVRHRETAIFPGELEEIADEPLVLGPLPDEAEKPGVLPALSLLHLLRVPEEFVQGPRRAAEAVFPEQVVPVVQDPSIDEDGQGDELPFVRVGKREDAGEEGVPVPATGHSKVGFKRGKPPGGGELGEPRHVHEEDVGIAFPGGKRDDQALPVQPRVHRLAQKLDVDPRIGGELPNDLLPEVEFDGAPPDGKGDRLPLRGHAFPACERQPRRRDREEREECDAGFHVAPCSGFTGNCV
jgi:hypothetical protein